MQEKPVIAELQKYIGRRSAANPDLHNTLSTLLSPDSDSQQVGLILTERFINMPTEVVPPMYTMLMEEIEWALQEKEPYQFSHYLIVSRVYTEVASKLDVEDSQPKKKKKSSESDAEVFYFHPEDEVFQQHSVAFCSYEFEKKADEGASDSRRVFSEMGIKPQGHMILIEADKFKGAIEAVKKYVGGPAAAQ
jgi:protein BCP1